MYKYLLYIFLLSFAFGQSGLELLEGSYQSFEGDGIKTRTISKKGSGYVEILTFEDQEGNIKNKFEAEFDVKQAGDETNSFIFIGKRNRQFSGKNFKKKEPWADMNGYSHILTVDEDFLYEAENLANGGHYKYSRVKENSFLSPKKLDVLKIMEGTWEGESEWGIVRMKFSFNNTGTVLTSHWDMKTDDGYMNTNTTVYGYDVSKQKITGRIFNANGFQIDVTLMPFWGDDNVTILTFTENGTESNGGQYQCITTFDFSEEGKLTWTAANRYSQHGADPDDASFVLTKK